MSQFTDYIVSDTKGNYYTYNRDGKDYIIATGMLNSLFKTHGYCVDPGTRSGIALDTKSIQRLKEIAENNNDYTLIGTIKTLSNGKAPSPRMLNDGIMHETTLNEKYRYEHLNSDNKTQILSILKIILNVGLYLGGWKGFDEPYITSLRTVYDTVRVELKTMPLIQSLYTHPQYTLVKNFPIMGYFSGGPLSSYASKPSVVDTSLNIDKCLNTVSSGLSDNYKQMASYLISTAYYYITTVCHTPLPMIEPLILSLTTSSCVH